MSDTTHDPTLGTGLLPDGAPTPATASVAALRQALEQLQHHIDNTPLAVIEWSAERRVVSFNRRAEEILGWSAGEVMGVEVGDAPWILDEDRERVRREGRDDPSGFPKAHGRVVRSIRKDGGITHNEWFNSALFNADGSLRSVLSQVVDRTESVVAREAQREADERLRSVISAMAEGVVVQALDGRIVDCNPAAERILGLTREQMEGRHSVDPRWQSVREDGTPFPGDEHPAMVTMRTGRSVSDVVMGVSTPDDEQRWISINAEPMRDAQGLVVAVVATFTDITARKRTELALAEFNRDFESFLDQTTDLVYYKDRSGRFRFCSQTVARLTGHRHWRDLVGKRDADVLSPAIAEAYVSAEAPVYRGTPQLEQVEPFVDAQGQPGWVLSNKWPIFDASGQVTGLFGISRDITRRRRLEEALAAAQQQLHLALEGGGMGLWSLDLATGEMWRTAQHDQLYGYSELQPKWTVDDSRRHALPEDWHLLDDAIREGLAKGHFHVEYRIQPASGPQRWLMVHGEVLLDASGRPGKLTGIVTDVTERRNLEAQLLQAQKLQAVGTLAGGIAHEINNVLAVVLGVASFLETSPDVRDPQMRHDLRSIETAANRGKELIQNLLGFARKGKYRKERMSPNALVTETVDVLRRTTLERVRFETELAPDLAEVVGDPGQVAHLVLNLCTNARDALGGKGTIRIRTDNVVLGATAATTDPDLRPGRYVRIAVIDDGAGMDPETVARAFDPFFTTKGIGEGTGLGLPMVYGTAKNHGGSVNIASQPGCGTTVTVLLPAADPVPAPSAAAGAAAANAAPLPTGTGTLLVVDDEPALREMLLRVARTLGYVTLSAANGPQAIETYRAERARVDLVILDLGMPGMDGAECFDALRAIDPGVRVLLCTGMGDPADTQAMLDRGALEVLDKPFDVHTLSATLARLVGARRPRT